MNRLTPISFLSLLLLAGCSGGPRDPSLVKLDFDRADERSFAEFYFAPYAADGSSVYDSGLLVEDGGSFFLNRNVLAASHPYWAAELEEPASDGVLDWDELGPFLSDHYYDVVDAPATLADFLGCLDETKDTWMEVEVNGVMTTALRHVLIPVGAVRNGLESYLDHDRKLIYPAGTCIVADHTIENEIVETTAMRKRVDGDWDYFVFDRSGNLAPSTTTPPKNLSVPTQCVGCHLGSRLYEPEKSYPADAPPGPEGPRAVHVADRLKNPEVVLFLNEHRKRSDGILGLYGTVYLSNLLANRADGSLSEEDAALLDKLGL